MGIFGKEAVAYAKLPKPPKQKENRFKRLSETIRVKLEAVVVGQTAPVSYNSRLINRRSLPLFLLSTVATVVNPFFR